MMHKSRIHQRETTERQDLHTLREELSDRWLMKVKHGVKLDRTEMRRSGLSPVSSLTQRTQPPANRSGRSKQPIIKAANQMLVLFAVFVYATHASHATQSLAFLAVFVYATHATQYATQSVALRALR